MANRGALARAASIVTTVMLVVGCGSGAQPSGAADRAGTQPAAAGERASLHIVNVDGPDVAVMLGGETVATVPCGGSATLEPGGSLPGLPWDLSVRSADGASLRSMSITGPLPQGVLIRGRSVITGSWPMSYGPAPSPLDAPCGSATPS
jgi:hypothetical protein